MGPNINKEIDNISTGINFPFVKRNAGKCTECGGEIMEVRGELQPCGECEKKEEMKKEIAQAKKSAYMNVLDKKYYDCQWEQYKLDTKRQENAFNKIRFFVDNFKLGKWLVFYGTQGTGKTFLKNCVLKELGKKGFDIYNTTTKTVYNEYLDTVNKKESIIEFNKNILKHDVIAIDEIGRVTLTESVKNFLFGLVDDIYLNNKTLIITSNLELQEGEAENEEKRKDIAAFVDFERIVEKSLIVPFTWESYRLKK